MASSAPRNRLERTDRQTDRQIDGSGGGDDYKQTNSCVELKHKESKEITQAIGVSLNLLPSSAYK